MADINDVVVILPRVGVSAQEIARFLRDRFQQVGSYDDGSNPLVNASIRVLEDHNR